MELEQAVYLSALPHRQGFHREGGWKSASPDSSEWRPFIREKFTALDRSYAARESRKVPELTPREREDIRVITFWDAEYPEALTRIFDPPPVLFLKGDVPRWNGDALAVVGTRDPAPVVSFALDGFLEELSRDRPGTCIVSGFARGVDGRAHQGAMTNGLPGIAVLGAGLRHAGPRRNLDLPVRARKLGVPFTLVSEFPPWVPGHARHFPRRNRIIAGLVPRVVIMQAPRGSGALITGRFALEEGRDVVVFDHELLSGRGYNEGGRDFLEAGAERLEVPGLDKKILREPGDRPGVSGPSREQLEFRSSRSRGEYQWLGGEYYIRR